MNSLAVQSTAEEHHASNSNSYELFRSTRDRFSFELLSFKQKMVKEIWKLFDKFDPPKADPFFRTPPNLCSTSHPNSYFDRIHRTVQFHQFPANICNFDTYLAGN